MESTTLVREPQRTFLQHSLVIEYSYKVEEQPYRQKGFAMTATTTTAAAFTPYGAAKFVNQVLTEAGLPSIPPQRGGF